MSGRAFDRRAVLGMGAALMTSGVHRASAADSNFAARLADLQRDGRVSGLDSLLVTRKGRLLFEYYGEGEAENWGTPIGKVTFGPTVLHDLRSVTKSIVGILYGIALADGRVPAPEARLYDQFPEYADLASEPGRERITIAHVLSMMEWTAPTRHQCATLVLLQQQTSQRGPSMDKASMIGLDIAKNVFEVHGRNAAGEVVHKRSLKRGQVEKFFSRLPQTVIGLEACGSAHHWGRVLGKLGHEVRLMPPAYVKPYVKRNKSDAIDAAACWEAMGRPDMRFVPVKTVEQQAALALHRSRDLLVSQRTQLGNALRALLAEFGIVAGKGKAGLAQLVDELRAGTLELPADAMMAAMTLADQHTALNAAAEALKRRIKAQTKADKRATLLQTAPGVGPLSAHAMLATLPDPSLFRSGRDFAAWLGLTPKLSGTGGKTRTGSITKKGNQPLRRLLVLGAAAWLRQLKARPDKASPWLRGLMARRPTKVVAVAQAARTARILWAMLTHNQPYRAPAVG